MNMEELVRKRQWFVAQIEEYLSNVRSLDTKVIEICMARIYDRMAEASDEAKRLDLLFKGLLVKSVYDKRLAGEKRKWSLFRGVQPEDVLGRSFMYPVPLSETLAKEWGTGGPAAVQTLLIEAPKD
jgi:hypothetical protein